MVRASEIINFIEHVTQWNLIDCLAIREVDSKWMPCVFNAYIYLYINTYKDC